MVVRPSYKSELYPEGPEEETKTEESPTEILNIGSTTTKTGPPRASTYETAGQPQPMTEQQMEVSKVERELEAFRESYEAQKAGAMEIIARPWKYDIEEWRDYKKSWEEYQTQAESNIAEIESYVKGTWVPPEGPEIEERELMRERREHRAFGPDASNPVLTEMKKLLGWEGREERRFGADKYRLVAPSEAEKHRFREASFTEWYQKALEESGGRPIKYDPETDSWYYEIPESEQGALSLLTGEGFKPIPGPAAPAKPGSIRAKIEEKYAGPISMVLGGLVWEEQAFKGIRKWIMDPALAIEEGAKTYREGEKWKKALTIMGASGLRMGAEAIDIVTLPVRPLRMAEMGMDFFALAVSPEVRKETLKEMKAQPLSIVGMVGGIAGAQLIGNVAIPKATSLIKSGTTKAVSTIAPKVPGLRTLYYSKTVGVPISTMPEFLDLPGRPTVGSPTVGAVKYALQARKGVTPLLEKPTPMFEYVSLPLRDLKAGIKFFSIPGVDTALKPIVEIAEFGPYTPSLSTMVKFMKMPGVRYVTTPPKTIAEYGAYSPSLRTLWKFKRMPGVSTQLPDQITLKDIVTPSVKKVSTGIKFLKTKGVDKPPSALFTENIPFKLKVIQIEKPSPKTIRTVTDIKTMHAFSWLFKQPEVKKEEKPKVFTTEPTKQTTLQVLTELRRRHAPDDSIYEYLTYPPEEKKKYKSPTIPTTKILPSLGFTEIVKPRTRELPKSQIKLYDEQIRKQRPKIDTGLKFDEILGLKSRHRTIPSITPIQTLDTDLRKGPRFIPVVIPRLGQRETQKPRQEQPPFPLLGTPSRPPERPPRTLMMGMGRPRSKRSAKRGLAFGWEIKTYPAKKPKSLLKDLFGSESD